MEDLKLKNAIINTTEIILFKKNGNINIGINDIKEIYYQKRTFFNFFLGAGSHPGYLKINLHRKINKTKTYFLKIKYEEFLKLPDAFHKITFY